MENETNPVSFVSFQIPDPFISIGTGNVYQKKKGKIK
jgi:hypothetical protein